MKIDKVLIGDIGMIVFILGIIGFIAAIIFNKESRIWALIVMAVGLILMFSEGEMEEDV